MSKIQVRRGASSAWTAANPTLGAGEFGFATEGILKIGDGTTPWNVLGSFPASNHSHGNPTLALTNLTGTTASNSAGLTLSLSAAPPGAGGGIAAAAGTETATSGTVVFAASNGITWGMSGSTRITASHDGLTTAAQVSHSHGNPTLALTNLAGSTASASNGLTISLSHNISTAALVSHSHGNPTLNLTNVAGTTASASNGLTLSLSVAAPGAGSGTALNLTNLTGTLSANTAGISLSMSAAAPGGGAAFAVYGQPTFAEGPPMVLITNLTGTAMTNRILLFPFWVHGNLTCQELMWYMSRATGGSNLFTLSQAFYTFVNSSQISRLASTSFQFSATNTASVSGIRIFELTPAQTTLSPGQYVLAMHFSGAATASVNYSLMGHSTLNWSPLGVVHPGADQNTISANATSHQLINFWGRHTTTTGAMPDTIGLNAVSGIGTLALPVKFWFGTHN